MWLYTFHFAVVHSAYSCARLCCTQGIVMAVQMPAQRKGRTQPTCGRLVF